MKALIGRLTVVVLMSTAVVLDGQITVGTNSVNSRWIGDYFGDGSWSTDITVTGTGTLSLGTCTGNALLCTALIGPPTVFSASTAPSTLTLGFDEFACCVGDVRGFVGTAVSHITVNSTDGCAGNCIIDVAYVAIPRSSMYQPAIITPSGSCLGCDAKTTNQGWMFGDNDLATFLPSQVPGGTFNFAGAAVTPISLSTNKVSLKWIGDYFGDGPWGPDITIAGTGTLSLGTCTGSALLCTALVGTPTVFSTATAPATLTIGFDELACCVSDVRAFVGTAVSHLTVNSTDGCASNCTIDVTYTAIPRSSMNQPTMVYPGGFCNGCNAKTTNQGWAFWDNDLAKPLPSQVPGGTFAFPGAGNSYTDANFGTVVRQLNNPVACTLSSCTVNVMVNDAAGLAWNADNSYFMTQQYNGFFRVWDYASGAIIYGAGTGFPGFVNWDSVNPNVLYYFSGNTIHKVTLVSSPDTWTDTVLYTYGGAGNILNGSNTNVTPDEWWTFFAPTDRVICIINLANVSQVPCTDPIDAAIFGVKSTRIFPNYDSATGYRYVVALDSDYINPPGINGNIYYRWKPGDAKITFSHFAPKQRYYRYHPPAPPLSLSNNGVCNQPDFVAGHCQQFAHEAVVEVAGRQFEFIGGYTGYAMSVTNNIQLVAAGSAMDVPNELGTGGGMYAAFSSLVNGDNHTSCATKAPTCLMTNDQDILPPPVVWWISGATTASPIHITICADGTNPNCPSGYTGSNGDVVLITAIYGITGFTSQVGANGKCTIANLGVDKKSWDCAGTTGVGTFKADSGIVEINNLPAVQPYQTEMLLFDYGRLFIDGTYKVIRVAKHRSISMADRYSADGYESQAHPLLSQDGTKVVWGTNFGYADQLVVMTALTGYTPPPTVITVLLSASSLNFGASGSLVTGPQTITVNFAGPGVAWTASSNQPTITVSPGSGIGNGAFQVSASAGPSGVITVSAPGATNPSLQVQVNVAACTYTVNPTTVTAAGLGGTGAIVVTAPNGCSVPNTSSNAAWASISLSGSIANWSVASNTSSQNRTGSFNIGGQSVPITQAGVPSPSTMSLSASSLNFGASGSLVTGPQAITVNFAGPGVAWTASSNQPTITVSPGSGIGNGAFQVSASAGPSGVITVSAPGATNPSLQVQVNVAACTYTVNPITVTAAAQGGTGAIVVTAPNACSVPNTSSNVAWASISLSGSTANWSVASNTSSQNRTGSFIIADQSVPITQAGAFGSSALSLSRFSLNFGASGSLVTGPQTITVNFAGPGVAWTASSNQPTITVSPGSGIGNGAFQVSASAGPSGVITVSAPGATNPSVQLQVNVAAVAPGSPLGSFDTPVSGTSSVTGAIAVTGWALDNIEVVSVDIWREPTSKEPAGLIPIGDAVFSVGARPDVEAASPNSPLNYRAGWGYLLLTNSLPNNGGSIGPGNGTYKLHAIAHNKAGVAVDLGTHTITVDNAHAARPFGSLDTPAQGGTASGTAFINFGWTLTQNPYSIPTDGSTLSVQVDGVPVGRPTYNQYRADIATAFPGLANSNGATGFYYIDTTKLSNGVHTLAWGVYDNAGRGDGIGSRYFTVYNSGVAGTAGEDTSSSMVASEGNSGLVDDTRPSIGACDAANAAVLERQIEELERIRLDLCAAKGYLLLNGERRSLPIGSSLLNGVFYWQPGPGFLGVFNLTFERPGLPDAAVVVNIRPKRFQIE
jgi:hypothetical protein